jgi:hypothetical protein
MSGERTTDQAPTVQICDDCFDAEKNSGNLHIVSEDTLDPSIGDSCEFCKKTQAEEDIDS